MKFSHLFILYLSAMSAPSVLAIPLRHVDHCSLDSTDVRCIGQEGDHGRASNPHLTGVNAQRQLQDQHTPMRLTPDSTLSAFHERGLSQTLKSILEGFPIIGPILAPLLGSLLGTIGLSEMDVASASKTSLNAEQIAALANFEFALSNAAHKVLLSVENPEVAAQSKLKARGVVPLGELTTAVPMIGPFLRPLVPLLTALNLEYVDSKSGSAFSLALLNEDQSDKLTLFQTILRQEVENIFPNANNSTPSDAPLPSKASPNDVMPSPTPELSSDTPEDEASDRDVPSPGDTPPMDASNSTHLSSPSPE